MSLPEDLCEKAGLDREELFAGQTSAPLRDVVQQLATRAQVGVCRRLADSVHI